MEQVGVLPSIKVCRQRDPKIYHRFANRLTLTSSWLIHQIFANTVTGINKSCREENEQKIEHLAVNKLDWRIRFHTEHDV